MQPSQHDRLASLALRGNLIGARQLAACVRAARDRCERGEAVTALEVAIERKLVDPDHLYSLDPQDAPSPLPASDPLPPEVEEARRDPRRVFGKFTLVSELGRGGMAVVHKAWDEPLARYVALKIARAGDGAAGEQAAQERLDGLFREARTAVKLRHPNIVHVFEVGEHDRRAFISMELIDGCNLSQALSGRFGPGFASEPRRLAAMLTSVARALEHAHTRKPPIVHGDVKPHNVLVDRAGHAWIVDFGLAREVRPEKGLADAVRGSPCYMAPEQARGAQVGRRTDVYGLGVVLYEGLTGRPPFVGKTTQHILEQVLKDAPIPPSQLPRAEGEAPIPPDLEMVCLKALAKEPNARYRSAGDLADDLRRFCDGEPVLARPRGLLKRLALMLWRRRALAVPVAIALVMTVALSVALARRSNGTGPAPAPNDPAAKLREAAKRVEGIVGELDFERAQRAYQDLIAGLEDGGGRSLIEGRLEDVRLQVAFHEAVVQRLQKEPRDWPTLELRTETLRDVRVIDATRRDLLVRHQGRVVPIAWGRLKPTQYLALANAAWPDAAGEAQLGASVFCVRHGLADEAARRLNALLGTPLEPQASNYLREIGREPKTEPASAGTAHD